MPSQGAEHARVSVARLPGAGSPSPVARIDGVTFAAVGFELRIETPGHVVHVKGAYQCDGDGYTVRGEGLSAGPKGELVRTPWLDLHYPADVHHDAAVLAWCAEALGVAVPGAGARPTTVWAVNESVDGWAGRVRSLHATEEGALARARELGDIHERNYGVPWDCEPIEVEP